MFDSDWTAKRTLLDAVFHLFYSLLMPDYRRYRVEGATYFFTLKTERNAPIFAQPSAVRLLGHIFREMNHRWPVDIDAIVLLPDHLHTLCTLPTGDADYSKRWGWLKKEFTQRYLATGGSEQVVSHSRKQNRRRGVWQRRFWEHTIKDADDFDAHFDYIHWNPVKHGYVKCPSEWKYSSFHRWQKHGVYPAGWGRTAQNAGSANNVKEAGE